MFSFGFISKCYFLRLKYLGCVTQVFHSHPSALALSPFTSCEEKGSSQESYNEKWMLVLYYPICWELMCPTSGVK